MLIRKSAAKVFEAFIDPSITRNFWFTKASGKLEMNKSVTWEWEMYGVSINVIAREIEPNKKIVFDWDDPPKTVEFKFNSLSDDLTYITVKESG